MELENTTDLTTFTFPQIDKQRRECAVVLATAAYTVDHRDSVRPSDEPATFQFTDEYHDDPKSSSLRLSTDLCYHKPRADIVFVDPVAHAPSGKPHGEWPIRVQVGELSAELVVTGPRLWHRGLFGLWHLRPPEPCLSMPVRFESAFGGGGRPGDPPDGRHHAANPVGLGWVSDKVLNGSLTVPAPQIYHPSDPPTQPNRPCGVAGLTPVAPSWASRLKHAGTYDQAWRDNDWPHYPADFDEAFFNVAPPALQHPGYLRGGERVLLSGLSPNGAMDFRLPAFPALDLTAYCMDGERLEVRLNLDTLVLDLGRQRFRLVWRAVVAPTARVFYSQLAFRK